MKTWELLSDYRDLVNGDIKMKGYKPPPKNIRHPNKPTPAPPPKDKPIILTLKDIDKLHVYFSDREIAQLLFLSKEG